MALKNKTLVSCNHFLKDYKYKNFLVSENAHKPVPTIPES